MSSTRKADADAPLSQERYMSSPDYNQLRGVSAAATAARAAVLPHYGKRNLIWWLQGMSLKENGLKEIRNGLLKMFPERLGWKRLPESGRTGNRRLTEKELSQAEADLGIFDPCLDGSELVEAQTLETMLDYCRHLAIKGDRSRNAFGGIRCGALSIEELLIDLCINPRLQIRLPGENCESDDIEKELATERYNELASHHFKPAKLSYFQDIIGALVKYKASREREIKENFAATAISRKIWETLDFALRARTMVLLDGLEGRGKTEAVKAWCELHLGEARFVSLKGINNKTTAFREIGKAFGVVGSGYKSTELQARIEDVLQRSKLMLILDEGHFIFNQGNRIYTRPELADWIHTLSNRSIPIALVTTPQFMVCLTRANKHVDWNYRQFRRRVKRYVKLPAKNTPRDIETVIRSALPGAPNSAVKQVLAYVHLTKRDLSAVGDVVDEIKAVQGCEQLTKVTYEEVVHVIDEHLVPSEKDFVEAITEAEEKVSPRRSRRARAADVAAVDSNDDETGDESEQTSERSGNDFSVARETQPSRLPSLLNTI